MSPSATPSCPTPDKRRFATRKEAKAFLSHGRKKRTRQLSAGMKVYLCPCGDFHMGHLHVIAKHLGRSEYYG